MEIGAMWRVKDWDRLFENSRTRAYDRLGWVPMPNKHDGDGYTSLVEHDHGAAHYGAWCVLVQVASKCSPRGTLIRDNGVAHDAESLSRLTRISARIFREAIPRLIEIGWLETDRPLIGDCQPTITGLVVEKNGESDGKSDASPGATQGCSGLTGACQAPDQEQNRTEQKRKEKNIPASAGSSASENQTAEPAVLVFPTVGRGPREWALTQAFLDELAGLYPNVNVLAECQKALLKIRNKAVTAKTARGMPKFLYSWMDRTQNSSRAGGGDGSRQRSLPIGPGQVHPDEGASF